MTNDEIKELMGKGQSDGAQLYRVADVLYKVTIVLNIIVGIAGVVMFFVAMSNKGFGPALAVAIVTVVLCAIGYAIAVLGSNGAKVLVHLLFANLALLDKQREQRQ